MKKRCFRCGSRPAPHRWGGCPMGGALLALCDKCDIKINRLFLRFMRVENWKEVMRRYRRR